jgi:hypothetical protein
MFRSQLGFVALDLDWVDRSSKNPIGDIVGKPFTIS